EQLGNLTGVEDERRTVHLPHLARMRPGRVLKRGFGLREPLYREGVALGYPHRPRLPDLATSVKNPSHTSQIARKHAIDTDGSGALVVVQLCEERHKHRPRLPPPIPLGKLPPTRPESPARSVNRLQPERAFLAVSYLSDELHIGVICRDNDVDVFTIERCE